VVSILFIGLVLYIRHEVGLLCSSDSSLAAPLPPEVQSASDVEEYLSQRDAMEGPVQICAESTISWAQKPGVKTDLVILNLHGWSASPMEIDPVDARVSSSLKGNLLRYRLTGHGLRPLERAGMAMRDDASREALLRDACVAYACAKKLGERVVIFGSSTGATLAVWLACQPWAEAQRFIASMVFVSPAFALQKPSRAIYQALKWFIVLLPDSMSAAIIHAVIGRTNRLHVISEAYARAWTTVYPSAATRTPVQLYMTLEVGVDIRTLRVPVLFFVNPKDTIVDGDATRRLLLSPGLDTEMEVVTDSEMPHVLTGAICSPSTCDAVTARSLRFIRSHA
jgi:pimeloyl-ACP methyl ester carboxylesterase